MVTGGRGPNLTQQVLGDAQKSVNPGRLAGSLGGVSALDLGVMS